MLSSFGCIEVDVNYLSIPNQMNPNTPMPRLTARTALDSLHTVFDALIAAHPFDRITQTVESRTLYFNGTASIIKLDAAEGFLHVWCTVPVAVARRFKRASNFFKFAKLPGSPNKRVCVKRISSERGVASLVVYLRELLRLFCLEVLRAT